MKKLFAVAAAAALLAACQGDKGPAGGTGPQGPAGPAQPGAGTVALEPAGVVGIVKDTAGAPVVGATVYLVPSSAIPTSPIDLSTIATARASTVDEPLEDTIAVNGASYTKSVTDQSGVYRIATVPAGGLFVTVVPAAGDADHLPGGSVCRSSLQDTALVGKQLDIKVSTKPSGTATYVGPTVCLSCHGVTHEKQTLHMLGIRPIGVTGPLQDGSRFPNWNDALAKFSAAGTTLYYYAFAAGDWKVSETDPRVSAPATVVSLTAKLYSTGTGAAKLYFVDLTDVKGNSVPATKTYPVEFSYGGGLYKQRYMTNIGGSRYILPIQYNQQAAAGLAGVEPNDPQTRWTWQQYNAGNWYVEDSVTPTSSHLKEPAVEKSFDNSCAGCHFSGYKLVGNKASAVVDPNGEVDFDGDGQKEVMNVSCENCHGPGSEHYASAGQGKGIVSPSLLTPERAVTICARCHTRTIGNGGLPSASGALNTEAPLGASGEMPVAGISRAEFLASYVSKIDDGLWTAAGGGDGTHSQKHHQQASDFIKSQKYRNSVELMTCTGCHDVHGNSGLPHQLQGTLDSASGAGMCLSCHDATFPAGATTAARMQAHWASHGVINTGMGSDIRCVDCHMAKTAKSGSGLKQATLQGVTYYSGDISSHVFDVPRRASIANKSAGMMSIPYTNKCGVCHTSAP